jgi:hypothetical protein
MVSMLLQSTAGPACLGVEDRHRMRNRLLVLANGLQETARIRAASRSASPTRGPMTGIGDYPNQSLPNEQKSFRVSRRTYNKSTQMRRLAATGTVMLLFL